MLIHYITARDAAVQWNISQRRVAILCAEKRIPGASMLGNMWIIPKDAKKPQDERMTRHIDGDGMLIKPFVKWAGGKSQTLTEIRNRYPSELGHTILKYAEPFVGGGAVLFDLLSKYQFSSVYISDINKALITTYTEIRDNVEELIFTLKLNEDIFHQCSDIEEQKKIFHTNRTRFNELISRDGSGLEIAVFFIFLNKTCFNGLYRVNRKGEFNVPMGRYKNPRICDEVNLRRVSQALKTVEIIHGNYKNSEYFIDDQTFVYFDPPYRPLSSTSGFTSYAENGFSDEDQKELAGYIDVLHAKGAYILASNSDPRNKNPDDSFFDNLYQKYNISRIQASRTINSNRDGRGKINELLIDNYMKKGEKYA